jgi:hypothetical protein
LRINCTTYTHHVCHDTSNRDDDARDIHERETLCRFPFVVVVGGCSPFARVVREITSATTTTTTTTTTKRWWRERDGAERRIRCGFLHHERRFSAKITFIFRLRVFSFAAREQSVLERGANVERGEFTIESGRYRRRHERDVDFNRFDVGIYRATNTRDGGYGWICGKLRRFGLERTM